MGRSFNVTCHYEEGYLLPNMILGVGLVLDLQKLITVLNISEGVKECDSNITPRLV
jgi:hypothetical protein